MHRFYSALGSILIYSVMGLFALVITLIVAPFYILKEWLFPSPYRSPEQSAVDEFHGLYEAFATADIAFLEMYAASVPEFPQGNDAFIQRSWLTNAICSGNLSTIAWVLEQGVDIDRYDDEGCSALTWAIDSEEDAEAIVALLIEHGADVNAKGTLDETPLHIAAGRGSVEVVALLLKHGADPCTRDSDYDFALPMDRLDAKKRPEIRDLLRAAMDAAEARG